MLQNNIKYPIYKQRMSTPVKILNAFVTILIVIAFIGFLFYNNFSPVSIHKWDFYSMGLSFILIGLFYAVQYVLALINNLYYIPKLKKKADRLPFIGIQMIGMN